MRIYKYGTKILRKVAKEVNDGFPTRDYSMSMYQTLAKTGGVGLACPQIGESVRMFVIDVDGTKESFVNPTIEYIGEKVYMDEGCLSIPGVEQGVMRHENIRVHYWTDKWKEKTKEFSGIVSRVIQHEYDHLDGILFIDYLTEKKRLELGPILNKISHKNKDVYAESSLGRIRQQASRYGSGSSSDGFFSSGSSGALYGNTTTTTVNTGYYHTEAEATEEGDQPDSNEQFTTFSGSMDDVFADINTEELWAPEEDVDPPQDEDVAEN